MCESGFCFFVGTNFGVTIEDTARLIVILSGAINLNRDGSAI
jgi:hypothetical protein